MVVVDVEKRDCPEHFPEIVVAVDSIAVEASVVAVAVDCREKRQWQGAREPAVSIGRWPRWGSKAALAPVVAVHKSALNWDHSGTDFVGVVVVSLAKPAKAAPSQNQPQPTPTPDTAPHDN